MPKRRGCTPVNHTLSIPVFWNYLIFIVDFLVNLTEFDENLKKRHEFKTKFPKSGIAYTSRVTSLIDNYWEPI